MPGGGPPDRPDRPPAGQPGPPAGPPGPPGRDAEREVVVPGDNGELIGVGVPVQVGVVAGAVDVVEVVDQVLEGEVGGEGVHVEVIAEARRRMLRRRCC